MTDTQSHTIDAKGQSLGRVASRAAHLLMGKNLATFAKNKRPETKVTITNASKLVITEKKRSQKKYLSYSGYPGGLKEETLTALMGRRGIREAIVRAVQGMIPRNKLRKDTMKRLV